jgi:glycosyltransferase involved in cell wall biosynthesis
MLGEGAGVLVESKSVDALVIALDALILDSQKRTDMAKKAYLKAMSFYTIDVVFRSYLEIWKNN